MSIKSLVSILAVIALCMAIPQNSAQAGYRDGALAAGIIGAALGTAIMMQGQRAGAFPSHSRRGTRAYHRSRHQSGRKKLSTPGEANNAKDPFAGSSAPADYAKPVSSHSP